MLINIKSVKMFDTRDTVIQIIYAPTKSTHMGEERDKDIMKAIVNSYKYDEREYCKFKPIGIKGAERVKNADHLYCDSYNNIWQICCSKAKDMNNNDIPNCWYVRLVGYWFTFDK